MRRRAAWLLLTMLVGLLLSHPSIAAPKTLTVAQYRALLQTAATKLERMENRAPRRTAPVLKPLAAEYIVRRSDGTTQKISGIALGLPSSSQNRPNSRQAVQETRAAIQMQLKELNAWEQSQYTPADAQAIIKQLEGSGQIQTGPSWIEQAWADFYKAITGLFKRFVEWLGGLFPSGGGPNELPEVDPVWIRVVFFITVAALLAAIAYLVWQVIGNRRRNRPQGAFAFSPEDAELLALPPDELRLRATRFASEGNFREALRHLYIALLLNLDARGVWRYDARRTNWEHIHALEKNAAHNALVTPLADITHRFDRVRYGNADCTREDWDAFERDVTKVEAATS